MTRAFIAIRPPDAVLDAIDARVGAVPMAGARPTTRDQWHLTLKFLGDDADIAAVESAFASAPLDVGAAVIRLGGVEALGNRRRARILAFGLRDGVQWTANLSAEVDNRLAPFGFPSEDPPRPFRAHLTLARFRAPTDLQPLCDAIGDEPVGPPWRVDEIVVFESRLRPEGAEHLARSRIAIAAR